MANNHTETLREKLDFIRVEGLGTPRYREYEDAPYALVVRATMPFDAWTGVFYSWMSLKGHLQGPSRLGPHGALRQQMGRHGDRDVRHACGTTQSRCRSGWTSAIRCRSCSSRWASHPEEMDFQLMRDFS